MHAYLNLLQRIRDQGTDRPDRTGVGTRSLFGARLRLDLAAGFPLVTTRKMRFTNIVHELIWMVQGQTDIKILQKEGVHIWDAWADANGNLGPVYGYQWRSWEKSDGTHIDQLSRIVEQLRRDPDSRRHVLSSWSVPDIPRMALPPCALLHQFYIADGQLSTQIYMRSADACIGLPHVCGTGALFTALLARTLGLEPAELIIALGDVHIYHNHLPTLDEQLARGPLPPPRLRLSDDLTSVFDARADQIALDNYHHHGALRYPIAV